MSGPSYIVSIRRVGRKDLHLCDDGKEYTLHDLVEIKGICPETIRSRIAKLRAIGKLSNPSIFHTGHLTGGACEHYGINHLLGSNSVEKFDRSRCKRDSVLCINYGECQLQRIGLSSAKWIEPEDTDKCFKETPYRHTTYRSSLGGCSEVYL